MQDVALLQFALYLSSVCRLYFGSSPNQHGIFDLPMIFQAEGALDGQITITSAVGQQLSGMAEAEAGAGVGAGVVVVVVAAVVVVVVVAVVVVVVLSSTS